MSASRLGEETVSVELPGGLMAGGRHLDRATLRALSGREEQWLARHGGLPSAVTATRLLAACVVDIGGEPASPDLVRRLLVGDRDFLVLALRRMTLGERFQCVIECPRCAERIDVGFDAADVPVEVRPQTAATYTLELGAPGALPRVIAFRLPTGGDQEAVIGMEPGPAAAAVLASCIVDDGGRGALSAEDGAEVEAAMERLAPRQDLELDLTCPACGHAFVAPFDVAAFFFHEMRTNGAQLLRETHALALSYHWSEADILGLARDRRRAYLDLLRETWRRD